MLAASQAREEKEARSRERYQRGELSLDVHDMRGDWRARACGTSTTRTHAQRDHRHPRPLHHRARSTQTFRDEQLAALDDPTLPPPSAATISDDEIRESVEHNQLRVLRERGGDLMLFSPKASGMEHHVPDQPTATAWARASNDLVHRVTQLFPEPSRRSPAAADPGRDARAR